MGSVLAIRADHYIYKDGEFPCYWSRILHLLGWEVPLLIVPDTTFIRMGSVLANRARYYIY